MCNNQVTTVVEKLIEQGWDIVSDQHLDARTRVWLHEDLTTTTEVAVKLEQEQLVGVLIFTESTSNTLVAEIVEPTQSASFSTNTQIN